MTQKSFGRNKFYSIEIETCESNGIVFVWQKQSLKLSFRHIAKIKTDYSGFVGVVAFDGDFNGFCLHFSNKSSFYGSHCIVYVRWIKRFTTTQRKKAHLFIIQLVFFIRAKKLCTFYVWQMSLFLFNHGIFFTLSYHMNNMATMATTTMSAVAAAVIAEIRFLELSYFEIVIFIAKCDMYFIMRHFVYFLSIMFTYFILFSLEIIYFCVYIYVVSWKYVMVWCV